MVRTSTFALFLGKSTTKVALSEFLVEKMEKNIANI